MKPILIIVTGRPGAGKTTLSERMSREWCLPLISRDRMKEGYVHTLRTSHDELPPDANLTATNAFFDLVGGMLDRGVSCIAEAAFQHRLWAERLPALANRADVRLVICRVDEQLALDRFLARGMNDPDRLRFHGDKGVRMALAGETVKSGAYEEPRLPYPTCHVETADGYQPTLEQLKQRLLPA